MLAFPKSFRRFLAPGARTTCSVLGHYRPMRLFCSSVNFQAAKPEQMGMVFTCIKCDTRTARYFSKLSYTKGVVIVQCPHCKVRHLVADNLGWFKDNAENIETFLQEQGDKVKIVEDVAEISPTDLEALRDAQKLQTKKFEQPHNPP